MKTIIFRQIIKIRNSPIHLICLFISLIFMLSAFSGCKGSNKLSIQTKPDSANVYLDDMFVGSTPINIDMSRESVELLIEFGEHSVSGIASKPGKALKKLTTAYLPLTANLPLFVALENGYFKSQGIEVEAIEATSPNDIVTGIVSGDIDFAAVLAYSILFPAAIRYPGTFKLYSSSEETSERYTSSIITNSNSSIDSYEDLRGKKIGVYTGLVQINFLRAILAGMGIDESDIEIIQISPRLQIQGLVSGEYDALSTTEPTVNIARLKGIAKVVSENPRVRYIMCPFPSTAAPISTKLLAEDPSAARGVVKALEMAIDFINSNSDDAKKTLIKYTPIPTDISDKVLADLKLFKYCKLGEENRLNVQRFADFLHDAGIISERIKDVNMLFGDYNEEYTKE